MQRFQKTALSVTRWIGSPASLAAHTLAFAASFAAVQAGWIGFQEMLLVLTTIVSLEAIYLSIFIQMTINYTSEAIEEVSEDVEELQEDIGEIQEDVEEITEDFEERNEEEEEEEAEEEKREAEQRKTLADIQSDLRKLMLDIERLQNNPPAEGSLR